MTPIPDDLLPQAAAMWWAAFGRAARPLWPGRVPEADGTRGLVAVDGGRVVGVTGLRDAGGGFLQVSPDLLAPLFRAAPPTADLVIDGIMVDPMLRRGGVGCAMIGLAARLAAERGHSGLRAEVALRNDGAVAFWRAMGFAETARGRFGWPWGGQVLVMRRAGPGALPPPPLAGPPG
ncbi:MAG: GNAT family N-acetyltransferase [Paracoccus sp. (in: a-proteobacteria)]|nr:GNAT family N-acetyltransferase [Paracoccus sp. (in: a-proteobacteria)]